MKFILLETQTGNNHKRQESNILMLLDYLTHFNATFVTNKIVTIHFSLSYKQFRYFTVDSKGTAGARKQVKHSR